MAKQLERLTQEQEDIKKIIAEVDEPDEEPRIVISVYIIIVHIIINMVYIDRIVQYSTVQ